MSKDAATVEETPEAEELPAVPVHDGGLGERLGAMVEAEAAAAEAEDDSEGDPDTDEAGGETEGESEADGPEALAARGKPEDALKRPPFDPLTKGCPVCEGWGTVSTHSAVEEYLERRCWRCKGAGYLEKQLEPEEQDAQSSWKAPTPEIAY